MLGEDGLFGHSIFHIGATKVPFLYYSDKKDEKFKKQIVENITHYEMSLLIAQKLGFKIINPNINDHETFFIHGNNHNNVYEVMDCYEITKNDDQASYHYKKLF